MPTLNDPAAVEAAVRQAVATTTASDIHTHLFPPSHGELLLWGVDELLTYHYLVAELFTVAPRELTVREVLGAAQDCPGRPGLGARVPASRGAERGRPRRADDAVGLGAGRGAGGTSAGIRRWFAAQKVDDYLAKVFRLANIDYAVMTNNPFIAEEAAYWKAHRPCPDCLKAALRIDTLILDWPAASTAMRAAGYKTTALRRERGPSPRRGSSWPSGSGILKPVYLAASLPPDFAYPLGGDQLQGDGQGRAADGQGVRPARRDDDGRAQEGEPRPARRGRRRGRPATCRPCSTCSRGTATPSSS